MLLKIPVRLCPALGAPASSPTTLSLWACVKDIEDNAITSVRSYDAEFSRDEAKPATLLQVRTTGTKAHLCLTLLCASHFRGQRRVLSLGEANLVLELDPAARGPPTQGTITFRCHPCDGQGGEICADVEWPAQVRAATGKIVWGARQTTPTHTFFSESCEQARDLSPFEMTTRVGYVPIALALHLPRRVYTHPASVVITEKETRDDMSGAYRKAASMALRCISPAWGRKYGADLVLQLAVSEEMRKYTKSTNLVLGGQPIYTRLVDTWGSHPWTSKNDCEDAVLDAYWRFRKETSPVSREYIFVLVIGAARGNKKGAPGTAGISCHAWGMLVHKSSTLACRLKGKGVPTASPYPEYLLLEGTGTVSPVFGVRVMPELIVEPPPGSPSSFYKMVSAFVTEDGQWVARRGDGKYCVPLDEFLAGENYELERVPWPDAYLKTVKKRLQEWG